MDVTQILNGPSDLNAVPFPDNFTVSHAKQALFVAGSVWWDISEPSSGMHASPPDHVGIQVVIDATRSGGKLVGGTVIGNLRLGRSEPGFHATVVPAVFPLTLPPGPHRLSLVNENNGGGTVVQSNTCFFSATLFDFD